MGLQPITGQPIQYQKADGALAFNYYLKAYKAGTNTPLFIAPNKLALDDLGNEIYLDKVRLNELGYAINPSGGVIIPHLAEAFKLVLYRTAEAANANNTAEAEWIVDNLTPGLIGFNQEEEAINATDVDYIADASAITRSVATKLKEFLSVKDFGAVGDGVTDDSTAINTALLVATDLIFPPGVYLMGGLIVQTQNQNLHFFGNVTLRANANNVVLFKQVTSQSHHTGTVFFASNSKTGVSGLQVGPSSITDQSTLNNCNNNILPRIFGTPNLDELVTVQCGPQVGGSYSFCINNTFPSINANGARRGLWFRPPPHASSITPANNIVNQFVAISGSNTGVDIDSGTNNTIHYLSANGVNSGTAPNAIPVAFRVRDTCPVTSRANNHNSLIDGSADNCTQDISNANRTTRIVAFDYDRSKTSFSRYPRLFGVVDQVQAVYFGTININASAILLPAGWTASRLSAGSGTYTITHNLGTTGYGVIPVSISDGVNAQCKLANISSNSFSVVVERIREVQQIGSGLSFVLFLH